MFFKKKPEKKTYDENLRKPAIRVSICTGEKVAGFINTETDRFEEIMLVNNDKDLKEFMDTYDIKEKIKEFY